MKEPLAMWLQEPAQKLNGETAVRDSPEIPTWVKGNGMVCQSHEDHQEERKMNIRINCKRDRISVRSRRSMSPHKYNACSRITRESPYASQS